jgi:eukaryotic-like serine/threonine-protein kinase
MATRLQCPNPACSRTSISQVDFSGQSVKCKFCGQVFIVPTETITRISRFVIRAKLGQGAFGAVYRAYDPQLDREVAIKIPHASVVANPNRVERFLREAKAAAKLRHPHIVPVFDTGTDGTTNYIATAFIEGKPLSHSIEESGVDLQRTVRLMRELCEALAYAHEEGIVHRDVKPENILVDQQDRIHLLDFGLATRQEDESKLTNEGAVMGTPSYMAPEQAAGNSSEAGPAADQYAAGVVLYELLTGRLPFEGPPAVVMHNTIHSSPPTPSSLRKDLPRDLETICLKVLSKDPKDRYPSCLVFADDLRRWQEGEPITARPLSTFERIVRWSRKNQLIATAIAISILFLCLGTVVSTFFAIQATESARLAIQESDRASLESVRASEAQREAQQTAEREMEQRQRAEKAAAGEEEARKKAEAERQKAEEAARLAESERQKATMAALAATSAQAKTAEALSELQSAQERVLESEMEARSSAYGAFLALAFTQIQTREYAQATRTLSRCQVQQRGWEWRLLSDWAENSRSKPFEVALPKKPTAAAFTPDGEILVTGSMDGTVSAYRTSTGKAIWTSPAHGIWRGAAEFAIRDIAVTPDGKLALSVGTARDRGPTRGQDSSALVWDLATGKVVRDMDIPPAPDLRTLDRVAISPDGTRAAASDLAIGQGLEWDFRTGKVVNTFISQGAVAFAPSPDAMPPLGVKADKDVWFTAHALTVSARKGIIAFSRGGNHELTINTQGGKRNTALKLLGHSGQVRQIALQPDESRLASAGADGVIKLWDVTTGIEYLTLPGPGGAIVGLTTTADGIFAVTDSGKLARWLTPPGASFVNLEHKGPVLDLAWNPNGDRLAVSGRQSVRLYRLPEGSSEVLCDDRATSVVYAPNGQSVAIVDATGSATLIDVQSKQKTVIPHTVTGIQWVGFPATAGGLVVFAYQGKPKNDLTAGYWDLIKGQFRRAAVPLVGGYSWAMDPTRKVIAVGSTDRVAIFDASSWSRVGEIPLPLVEGKLPLCPAIQYSPDGKLLAVTSNNQLVWIIETRTGRIIQTLRGHKGSVQAVVFHPDSSLIITSGADETARISDSRSGKLITALHGHGGPVGALSISPDGRKLACGSTGGIRIWDLQIALANIKR